LKKKAEESDRELQQLRVQREQQIQKFERMLKEAENKKNQEGSKKFETY
jgi:hypothetical protein